MKPAIAPASCRWPSLTALAVFHFDQHHGGDFLRQEDLGLSTEINLDSWPSVRTSASRQPALWNQCTCGRRDAEWDKKTIDKKSKDKEKSTLASKTVLFGFMANWFLLRSDVQCHIGGDFHPEDFTWNVLERLHFALEHFPDLVYTHVYTHASLPHSRSCQQLW